VKLAAAGLLIFVFASAASGETVSRMHLYLSVGGAYPFGGLADRASYGLDASFGLGLVPVKSSPDIEIVLRPGYSYFPAKNDYMRSFRFMRLGLDVRLGLSPGERTRAYLLLGGGMSRTTMRAPKLLLPGVVALDRTKYEPFASVGIGLDLLSHHDINGFVELRFYDISDNAVGDFRFVKFSLGLRR
jgi:hypothetical protein